MTSLWGLRWHTCIAVSRKLIISLCWSWCCCWCRCCAVTWKWRGWKLSALCNLSKKQNPRTDKAAVCWTPHRDTMFDYELKQSGRPAFTSFKEAEGEKCRSEYHYPLQQFLNLFIYFPFSSLLLGNCSTPCWVCWFDFTFFATAWRQGEVHGLSVCGLPSTHVCKK